MFICVGCTSQDLQIAIADSLRRREECRAPAYRRLMPKSSQVPVALVANISHAALIAPAAATDEIFVACATDIMLAQSADMRRAGSAGRRAADRYAYKAHGMPLGYVTPRLCRKIDILLRFDCDIRYFFADAQVHALDAEMLEDDGRCKPL